MMQEHFDSMLPAVAATLLLVHHHPRLLAGASHASVSAVLVAGTSAPLDAARCDAPGRAGTRAELDGAADTSAGPYFSAPGSAGDALSLLLRSPRFAPPPLALPPW